ncbi:MAG: hypothetical protein SFX72_09275 [Isosphaeraceae bacterium]|nr:hypothetical protein [Isosphaeraceae bacterium]
MSDLSSAASSRRAWSLLGVFRGPRFASAIPPVLIAALGVEIARGGLLLIGRLFATNARTFVDAAPPPLARFEEGIFGLPFASALAAALEPAGAVIRPFLVLFSSESNTSARLHALLAGLWLIVVWECFGAAISRSVMIRGTTGIYLGIIPSLRFALRKAATLIGTPLAPITICLVLSVPGAIIALLSRLPVVGEALGAILGFVPLVFGVMSAVILFGLALGWPLIATTIAAEAEDGFDALSRSYSYVNHRFLSYLAGLAILVAASVSGIYAARLFVLGVGELATWPIEARGLGFSPWRLVISTLLEGWVHANFWSCFSIIYLWLRADVDGTEYDRIAPLSADAELPSFIDESDGPLAEPKTPRADAPAPSADSGGEGEGTSAPG